MALLALFIVSLAAFILGVVIVAANMSRAFNRASVNGGTVFIHLIGGLLASLGGIGTILTGVLLAISYA